MLRDRDVWGSGEQQVFAAWARPAEAEIVQLT